MDEEISEGVLAALESFAKSSVVGLVLLTAFTILAWPFINFARLIVLILTLGMVRPNYRKSLDNGFIVMIAMLTFLFIVFYLHLVYGAKIYGNES